MGILSNPLSPIAPYATAIKLAAAGIAAAALIALVWSWHARGEKIVDLTASLKLADAEIALLHTDAALKEVAAVERQADTAAIAASEKELVNAIAEVPDTAPDHVRVRLGCERLRQRAGGLDADLPAVCRPGGGAETGPAR
jgi:hypothetical protein